MQNTKIDHCVEDILEKKSKKGIKVMSICKVLYVSASPSMPAGATLRLRSLKNVDGRTPRVSYTRHNRVLTLS
mgnify:CR=1 FL=1